MTHRDQIVENMKNFLNKRVMIMPPNRHSNKQGLTVRAEIPEGKKKAAMIVKLDDGNEIEVYDASQLFFITQQFPVNKIKDN